MAMMADNTGGGLLIVAATGMEVRGLVDEAVVDAALSQGRWAIVDVRPGMRVAVSGIGRANAAGATATALAAGGIGRVINVGICGALPGGGCAIGDVVIGRESVFAEEGIALPDGARDLRGIGITLYPGAACEGNVMVNDLRLVHALSEAVGDEAHIGRIATVARCSGSDAAARQVVEQTGAIVEAMEGAAVVLAARRMGVTQVGEVRVVSNTCGDRGAQEWDLERALGVLEGMVGRVAEV